MATDPIRAIRKRDHETELDLNVQEVMHGLAALPPSPSVPFLTVSLDWRPDGANPGRASAPDVRRSERRSAGADEGPSRRPSRQQYDRESAAILASFGPRGDAFDSLSEDIRRIGAYLDSDLDPSAQGVFIVACSAHGVFEPLSLGLPVETRISVGPVPALSILARLDDDYPTYAVLLADQHAATLSFIAQANLDQSVSLRSSDYPRKQMQGGVAQRRFQARADERVAAFARGIAEETRNALDESGVTMLVVAGDEVITSALDAAFHQSVKEKIVGTLRLDIGTSRQELIAAAQPVIDPAERRREVDAVQAIHDGIGTGQRGAGGADAVLVALLAGQVSVLAVTDDFSAAGWADYEMPLVGSGPVPTDHPAGGDVGSIVPVDLHEELIRLALIKGAAVQIVKSSGPVAAADLGDIPAAGEHLPRSEPAMELDKLGGVGAVLRVTA